MWPYESILYDSNPSWNQHTQDCKSQCVSCGFRPVKHKQIPLLDAPFSPSPLGVPTINSNATRRDDIGWWGMKWVITNKILLGAGLVALLMGFGRVKFYWLKLECWVRMDWIYWFSLQSVLGQVWILAALPFSLWMTNIVYWWNIIDN